MPRQVAGKRTTKNETPFWEVSYDSEKLKKLLATNKYEGVKSLKMVKDTKDKKNLTL